MRATAVFLGLAAFHGGCASHDGPGGAQPCPLGESCVPCPYGYVCYPLDGGADTGSSSADGTSLADRVVPDADATASQQDAGGSTPPASSTVTVLPYDVVDAELSDPLTSLVIVSTAPSNALHARNLTTGFDRTVPLPGEPVALSLDASGMTAAVAYDAGVSWVDLTTGTVKATCPTASGVFDVAITKAGIAYVTFQPSPSTDSPVHMVDLSSCTDTTTLDRPVAPSHVAMHVSEETFFTAAATQLEQCTPDSQPQGPPTCQQLNTTSAGPSYWSALCTDIWPSKDGLRIYTNCGPVLRMANDIVDPPALGGSLQGMLVAQHVSDAASAPRVAVIPAAVAGQTDPDRVVWLYETEYLGLLAKYDIPTIPLPEGGTAPAHGRFVFPSAAGDVLYVIEQADPSSEMPNACAIAAITP